MTDLILHLENLLADIEALETLHDCHPDKKAIHKLRVRIKMLKALVILLKWYFHDLDPDVLHATKKLFKRAGVVRDLQLLAEFVRRSGANEKVLQELKKLLRDKEDKAYKQYQSACRKLKKDSVKKIKFLLKPYITRMKEQPQAYFEKAASDISAQLMEKQMPDKSLHKIRREVKMLLYNLKLFYDEGSFPDYLPFQHLFLSKADKLLGSWHDATVAEGLLKKISASDELTWAAKEAVLQIMGAAAASANTSRLKFKYDINQYQK